MATAALTRAADAMRILDSVVAASISIDEA
jgi:hypothetical protein